MVSCPATSNRMQVDSISPSLSTVPSSSTCHQPTEQVVTGVLPPFGQQLEEVLRELEHALGPGRDDLGGQEEVGIEATGQGVRPALEAVLVLERAPRAGRR